MQDHSSGELSLNDLGPLTVEPKETGTQELASPATGGWKLLSGWNWKKLWAAPEPDLVDAGLRGEWMIAGIRLLMVLLLIGLPLRDYFLDQESGQHFIPWVAVAALAEALVIYSAVMRSWGRSWIGFFSGLLDVSLVSLCLLIFVRLDTPQVAVSDEIFFPLYLLAIGATSLRFDWRICVLTGAVAFLQYAFVLAWVVWMLALEDQAYGLAGTLNWNVQIGRFLLLILSTILATSLVVRAREQKHLSTRDRLTNLANRGFFDESLRRMEALASRSGDSVSIAMIDVDHFKRFNDTHGHLAGDEALRVVSRILAKSFRTTDLIARYGGEEFSGVFVGLDRQAAAARLERIRRSIEGTGVPVGSGDPARLTVSIGVASWPGDGDTLQEALAIADTRLYRAKQGGRNRVVSAAASDASAAHENLAGRAPAEG